MEDRVWVKKIASEELGQVPDLQGRWRRWVVPTKDNGGIIFGMGRLQPGEVAGWHVHPDPEIFFVLEGIGEARWQEGNAEHVAELRPGFAFYKVGGVSHQMLNLGNSPLTGVFFKVMAE